MAKLCAVMGVNAGKYTSDDILDKNPSVTAFVARMYTKCLKREYDTGGLRTWVTALLNGKKSGSSVANGFFNSKEIQNANLSNKEFVTRAYQTLLNRKPDSSGLNSWVNKLKEGTMSRQDVLNGFYNSAEFTNLCAEYGIKR